MHRYVRVLQLIALPIGLCSVVSAAASLHITPQSLNFGTVTLSSSTQQVTIMNPGPYGINIKSITVSSQFTQTNTCGSSIVFGASCTMNVTFTPTVIGSVSGTVAITFTDGGGTCNPCTNTIGLSGTGGGVQGFVNPKYVIVGVTYAPPGPNSNVTYTGSTLVGNTTTVKNSFQSGVNFTISVSGSIAAWSVVGGAATKITGTSSTDYSQTSGTSSTVTISKTTTVADKTNGTGNASSPVNHDYDTIWLWLNPLMILTADPQNTSKIRWNGYGYDKNDVNGMDVFGVQVGWLNGHFGNNPSINSVLARNWVTATEPGMTWPAGEGPGLTTADIGNILQADPFTAGTYVLPSPLPSTTSDGRFTQIPYPPNPVNYAQAGPGNGGGTTTTYNVVNTNTSTVGSSLSHSFKQAVGIQSEFKGGSLFGTLTVDLKTTWTFEWTHSWENTLTTTKTLTNALSVTGPGCPQTSPPCVPVYTGAGEFIVFQDNLYGTFMFYPGN
jgi:hypothetical protein